MPETVTLVDQAAAAHAALSPLRLRVLRHLDRPASASEIARELGLARQKVSYHLGVLERHGLVHLVDEQQRRGFLARRFVRSGTVVLAPDLVEPALSDRDAASAEALIAAAGDAIRTVGALAPRASAAGRALATATMVSDVTFRSPAELRAFLDAVAALAARYDAGEGHTMRLTLLAHTAAESRSTP